jgi:hypothetical protein
MSGKDLYSIHYSQPSHCICQEASVFFKKRALVEDEYGKTLQKLSRATSEVYTVNDGKAG